MLVELLQLQPADSLQKEQTPSSHLLEEASQSVVLDARGPPPLLRDVMRFDVLVACFKALKVIWVYSFFGLRMTICRRITSPHRFACPRAIPAARTSLLTRMAARCCAATARSLCSWRRASSNAYSRDPLATG